VLLRQQAVDTSDCKRHVIFKSSTSAFVMHCQENEIQQILPNTTAWP